MPAADVDIQAAIEAYKQAVTLAQNWQATVQSVASGIARKRADAQAAAQAAADAIAADQILLTDAQAKVEQARQDAGIAKQSLTTLLQVP